MTNQEKKAFKFMIKTSLQGWEMILHNIKNPLPAEMIHEHGLFLQAKEVFNTPNPTKQDLDKIIIEFSKLDK